MFGIKNPIETAYHTAVYNRLCSMWNFALKVFRLNIEKAFAKIGSNAVLTTLLNCCSKARRQIGKAHLNSLEKEAGDWVAQNVLGLIVCIQLGDFDRGLPALQEASSRIRTSSHYGKTPTPTSPS